MFKGVGGAISIPVMIGMLVVTKVEDLAGHIIGSLVSGCQQDVRISFLCLKSSISSFVISAKPRESARAI